MTSWYPLMYFNPARFIFQLHWILTVECVVFIDHNKNNNNNVHQILFTVSLFLLATKVTVFTAKRSTQRQWRRARRRYVRKYGSGGLSGRSCDVIVSDIFLEPSYVFFGISLSRRFVNTWSAELVNRSEWGQWR